MKSLRVLISLCLVVSTIKSETFNEADLDFVKLVHRLFCGPDSLCNPVTKNKAGGGNASTTITTDDLPIPVPDFLPIDCCKPCSCNLTTCVDYGTCCPDILDHLPTVEESQQPLKGECREPSVRGLAVSGAVWILRLCSREFIPGDNKTTADIQSRCENPENYADLETHRLVTDPETQRTYASRYCALCNNVNESTLIPWYTSVQCFDGDSFIIQNVDPLTIVRDILDTTQCDIEFEWPWEEVDFSKPECKPLVRECNITGSWRRYDPLIEAACHAYRANYNFEYYNIFCFQCNELENIGYCTDTAGREIGSVSFAAVLDFSKHVETEIVDPSTQCEGTQVYDYYKDLCRNLTCVFPRILRGNTCVNVANEMTEVAYKLQVKFQPIGIYAADAIDTMVPMIKDYTDTLFTVWDSLNAAVSYTMFYKFHFKTVGPSDTVLDVTPMTMLPATSDTTTASNRKILATKAPLSTTEVASPDNIRFPEFTPAEVTLRAILAVKFLILEVEFYYRYIVNGGHPGDFIDTILEIDETIITLNGQNGLSVNVSVEITDYDTSLYGYPVDPDDNQTLSIFPVFIELPKRVALLPIDSTIQTIKNTLLCPLVSVRSDEFNTSETLGKLYIEDLNTTFDRKFYYIESIDKSVITYSICRDKYIPITDRYFVNQTTVTPPEGGVTPQGILSVVCACISILCSVLTLITYLLFQELRTQPGINNMFLCVYLICAQALFTFAAPQSDIVSETACSIIGALVHFFWLMVVFVMNVCCIHMVMVFLGQSANRSKSTSKFRKSVLYTVYCVLSSLLFVAINIIVVIVDTDSDQNGYGGGICYISRSDMIGYVFALPLGVVILVNLVCFVTVIIKISRSPTVNSSNKNNRNYFKIYAKLSSVTGITWLFGFLFEFTDQEVFEYLFVILNGGIGVLIFFSFVCNKRIYRLFKGKITKTLPRSGKTLDQSSKTRDTELTSQSGTHETDTN